MITYNVFKTEGNKISFWRSYDDCLDGGIDAAVADITEYVIDNSNENYADWSDGWKQQYLYDTFQTPIINADFGFMIESIELNRIIN